MTKYTNEKKEHALSQMSAPHNKPVAEVALLTGVRKPRCTCGASRREARPRGARRRTKSRAMEFRRQVRGGVPEAAPLNEAELAAYCRRKGLLVKQLERRRAEVHSA
ncbi:hypothetical protein O3297_19225 [Janthinobacterium sp. SUN128]|uniref:hypothetical protein n=1 Tax=Janthinobacterium sp. SUN128 TaxID=3014790 RepID=UPI0027127B47|nr:hypothetical protein [Janthinobacterium sp. SUN128]MDO8035553.1 hypothetical protein [Janthinobacterium sp. SUN128]